MKGFGLNYDISIQGYLLQEGEKKSQISYREFLSFDNIAKVYCLNDIHNAPFSKLCRTEISKKIICEIFLFNHPTCKVIDFENLSFYLYKQVFQNRNFIEKIS